MVITMEGSVGSQIHACLRALASHAAAISTDHPSFHRLDMAFGCELAETDSEELTLAQAVVGARLLRRYRRELERLGLTPPDEAVVTEWAIEQHIYLDEEEIALAVEMADLPTLDSVSPAAEAPSSNQEALQGDAAEKKDEPKQPRAYIERERIFVEFSYDRTKVAALQPLKEIIADWAFNRYHRQEWSYPQDTAWSVYQIIRNFQGLAYSLDAVACIKRAYRKETLDQQVHELEQHWQELAQLSALEAAQPYLDGAPTLNGQRLFRHQREAVQRMIEAGRFILAHHMGLGKTKSSLIAALAYDLPIWVIAPAGTLINWQREAAMVGAQITLFSWAKLPEPPDDLDYVLITDEAHYAQSGEGSLRGQGFLHLADKARAVFMLSVTGDTPVTLRIGDTLRVLTMQEAVELMGLQGEGSLLLSSDAHYFVRSYDHQTNEMTWARIYGAQAHKSPEALVTIEAEGKIRLQVTQSHSVYVVREGQIAVPKASEIRPGDFLIRDDWVSVPDGPSDIDMVMRVADSSYVLYGPFEEQISQLKDKTGYASYYNWLHNGKHGPYLPYEWWEQIGRPQGTHWIAGHKGSKGHGCQATIPVSALAYLVGLVAGDGWIADQRLGIAVANADVTDLQEYLEQHLRPYFDYSVGIRQYSGCVNLRIACKPLVDLFRQWFGGLRATTKRLPAEVLTWPEEARWEVLHGLIESDGHISQTRKDIVITSISRMLLEDIAVLLRTLRVPSAIYKRSMKPDPRPVYANAQQSYQIHFILERRRPSHAERNTKENGISILGANLVKVQRVSIEDPTDELVYDFAVEGTENFVAGGIVCHNTGTPIKNSLPINLWPLLVAAKHPLASDQSTYEKRYCGAYFKPLGRKKSAYQTDGATNLDELHERTKDVILYKKKSECIDLPDKLRTYRPAEVSSTGEIAYRKTIERLREEHLSRMADKYRLGEDLLGEGTEEHDLENAEPTFISALVELCIFRHAASLAKVDAAAEIAHEAMQQGQGVLLFTAFKDTAERLATKLGVDCLTGEVTGKKRQAMIDRFQAEEVKALVATIGAGGIGVNLTAAQIVVLVDRPWTSSDAEQAEDRAYRIGQTHNILSIWLQYSPVDERIDQLLSIKQQRIETILRGRAKNLHGAPSIQSLASEIMESIRTGQSLASVLGLDETEFEEKAVDLVRDPVPAKEQDGGKKDGRLKGRVRRVRRNITLDKEVVEFLETMKVPNQMTSKESGYSGFLERLVRQSTEYQAYQRNKQDLQKQEKSERESLENPLSSSVQ